MPDFRGPLHDFTLEARSRLLTEAGEQLEGLYGLLPSGEFETREMYPALAALPEARETRDLLERFIADERAAGLGAKEARDKLAKEVVFTWLNRLVAFRIMETVTPEGEDGDASPRGLIPESVHRGRDSRGFKLWLTEPANEAELRLFEAGSLPRDAIGEGPQDRAYKHYILALCRQKASEIQVLFDAETLASRLFPRPSALAEMLVLLSSESLFGAWWDDQTIGGVYQYFNEREGSEIAERLRGGGKVQAADIPAATQIFTPRWVVKALIHNSLGRLWIEMHPDSVLKERLDYLVPNEVNKPVLPRLAKEITLLDPATGTMHFGLVAFDVFLEMYREEIDKVGRPGWPQRASVSCKEEIPAAIIANNLFGIDIDLRAVQLSALTLLLKAKRIHRDATISDHNLACADVLLLNGQRLTEFLDEFRFTRPIYERLIRSLWERLKDANQMGSLLRLEKDLDELIEEEKRTFAQVPLPGFPSDQFETEAGREEFWTILSEQVIRAFDDFAKRRAAGAGDASYFAREANKGIRVFELTMRRYDIVVTNPPYIDSRNYNPTLKSHMERYYPSSKRNLYAAFLERCIEFLSEGGRLGMITGQSFMFISSFQKLRELCLRGQKIDLLLQFDYGLFQGVRVDTAAFILRKSGDPCGHETAATYVRLVREADSESKCASFERAVRHLRFQEQDQAVFNYRESDFEAIPGCPWVYWINDGIRTLFRTFTKLGQIAEPRQGLATADNFRFLRFWWEAGTSRIGFGCASAEESKERPERWYPYMKGGGFKRWYGNQEFCINYGHDGFELKAWAAPLYGNSGWSRIIKSPEFYFRKGATWTDVTAGRFSARLSPGGFVFDVAGSSIFPEDIPLVLAVMNSSFSQYALKLINPTVHVQVGDLARLPVPSESNPYLRELVEAAISIARAESKEDETTYDYIAPAPWADGNTVLAARKQRLSETESEIDEEVYRLYGVSPSDRGAIEAELALPAIDDAVEPGDDKPTPPNPSASRGEVALAASWLGYAVGVVLGRFAVGKDGAIGRGEFPIEAVEELRGLADTDGGLFLDKGHPRDMAARLVAALGLMLGVQGAAECVRAALGNGGEAESLVRRYLERDFFKEHVKQYRKRPVYWLFQSPKRTFGLYAFHEPFARETLFKIQQECDERVKLIRQTVSDLQKRLSEAQGKARRDLERDIAAEADRLDDVREFSRRLQSVLDGPYHHHIDDGVLLSLAPLWELIPVWQPEPKRAWEELKKGKYDWSHTAMDYWPGRVREKCKTNKSYAIAHGLGTEAR
jgi:hypothetical protein